MDNQNNVQPQASEPTSTIETPKQVWETPALRSLDIEATETAGGLASDGIENTPGSV